MIKRFLDDDLCNNFFCFNSLSFILVLKLDFIRCVGITDIAASNTASDDVTNRSHREYFTQIYYVVVLIL